MAVLIDQSERRARAPWQVGPLMGATIEAERRDDIGGCR